jgi:hypothetical protein
MNTKKHHTNFSSLTNSVGNLRSLALADNNFPIDSDQFNSDRDSAKGSRATFHLYQIH